MRAPRVFVDNSLVAGASVTLETRAVRHLLRALRLSPGDPLVLFNGDGRDWHATLESATKHSAAARIDRLAREEPKPRLHIHVLLGISKGERMDYAIQKAVELGVDRITPLQTQRVVVKLDRARLIRRMHHWQGIILSACEQSGRSRIPVLDETADLHWALQSAPATGILLDPAAAQSLLDLVRPGTEVTLLIGPEGGLTTQERAAALTMGYQSIRLGPRVLRTETAPLAALAALQTLWGDFR
jgi:16S rRNA (uracil1498-N3)-methyltransferase